jgi:flagellum-specific ATP synthase
VRIDEQSATVKTFDTMALARIGEKVYCAVALRIFPDQSWKGRVINALGVPIDAAGLLRPGDKAAPLDAPPPPAMRRARVRKPLKTGVRVIDLFTPVCAGQRIGIFSGSGVGKSTLLAMLAGSRDFNTVVIALVGERGRARLCAERLQRSAKASRKSWTRRRRTRLDHRSFFGGDDLNDPVADAIGGTLDGHIGRR